MAANPLTVNNNGLAADVKSLNSLRAAAGRDAKSSIRETAKQFESLFMQQVMKSMRANTLATGMSDNSATQLGTELLDTQYAGKMAGLPGGLSDAIARQLQHQMGIASSGSTNSADASVMTRASGIRHYSSVSGTSSSFSDTSASGTGSSSAAASPLPALAVKNIPSHVQTFIQKHDAAARSAEASTGIPASFMIAQAAHESGWGKHEITNKDGSSAHNLFGIKATSGWTGKVAEVQTTEYVDGKPQKVTAKFRAYDSYEDAFKDYASLINSNDKYRQVAAQSTSAQGFAQGLQKAGYATDPAYAQK
ncbi:MAG: flagellar assembly peptidoglycan hydrolase FlgJ, partial [Paucibacter sp.]|nr:flagellar assembly peptidoglycan hydrolase FlgJ [Roseateles sp.]